MTSPSTFLNRFSPESFWVTLLGLKTSYQQLNNAPKFSFTCFCLSCESPWTSRSSRAVWCSWPWKPCMSNGMKLSELIKDEMHLAFFLCLSKLWLLTLSSQVRTYKNSQILIRESSQAAEGTLAFVIDKSELYIRVRGGWKKVEVSTLRISLKN